MSLLPWQRIRGETGVGKGMFAITPSNSADLAQIARAIYITVAGDLKAKGIDGVDFTVTLPANYTLQVAVKRVYATGTTATGIFGIA